MANVKQKAIFSSQGSMMHKTYFVQTICFMHVI